MFSSKAKPLIASLALALPACSGISELSWDGLVTPKGSNQPSSSEVAKVGSHRILTPEFKEQFPNGSAAFAVLCEAQVQTAVAISLGQKAEQADEPELARLEMKFLSALVKDLLASGAITPAERDSLRAERSLERFAPLVGKIIQKCGFEMDVDSLPPSFNAQYVFVRIDRRQQSPSTSELHALPRVMQFPKTMRFQLEELVPLARTELETPLPFVARLVPEGEERWRISLHREALDRLSAKMNASWELCAKTVVASECGRAMGQKVVKDPAVRANAKKLDLDEVLIVGALKDYYGARFGDLDLVEAMLSMRRDSFNSLLSSALFAEGKEKASLYASRKEAILEEFESLFKQLGISIPRR